MMKPTIFNCLKVFGKKIEPTNTKVP